MSDLRNAAEQALETLEAAANFFAYIDLHESFNPPTANFGSQVEELLIAAEPALRAALAEPVQQPHQIRNDFEQRMIGVGASPTALSRLKSGEYLSPSIQSAWDAEKKKYTHPPQRKPLTDEEIAKILSTPLSVAGVSAYAFARVIERAHGIGE